MAFVSWRNRWKSLFSRQSRPVPFRKPRIETLEDRLAPAVTGLAGGGQPFDTMQPYLTANYAIALQGIFPPREGGSPDSPFSSDPFIGEIRQFAFDFAPRGYALCQGQLLPIAQNTALFSLLGTTFGGDGRVNFALPDLRGRTPIGAGDGPGLSPVQLGETLGSEDTTLLTSEIPVHQHGTQTLPSGGSQPFDNGMPTLGLNAIIDVNSEIRWVAFNFEPVGAAFAHGQLLSIAEHESLFADIGTTYGGDGQNTFALPDLRGRVAIDDGAGVVLGETPGQEFVTLTTANLPSHSHSIPSGATSFVGGGQPFENRQPSLALAFQIAIQGIFPSRNLEFDTSALSAVDSQGNGLTETEAASALGRLVDEAIVRWQAAGVGDDGIAKLRAATYSFGSLDVGILAANDGPNAVTFDWDAAGAAWFLDATPADDAEFASAVPEIGLPATTPAAQSGIDLLTVVMHEQGHLLGFDHSAAAGQLMSVSLGVGVRRLPSGAEAPAGPDETDGDPEHLFLADAPFIAAIRMYAASDVVVDIATNTFAPTNGQTLAINQNQALFSLLGTTYGGDGQSTFRLPDIRGRVLLGLGAVNFLGEAAGTGATTLSLAQLPSHSHEIPTDVAPVGADNTVATVEDIAYTFTAADFGFSDDADSQPDTFLAVVITTLPGTGTLTNNGVDVTEGQAIAIADITGGLLQFVPAADGNGSAYAQFTFQVQDDGPANNLDPNPKTMTIDVNAVADVTSDSLTTTMDVPVTANVLTGTNGATADSFANANAQITSVSQGNDGSVTFTPEGAVTYTPNGGFRGSDSFTYTVTSGGTTETATVNVLVLDVTPPSLSVPGDIVVGNDPGLATAVVFYNVSASDGGGIASFNVSPPTSGSAFPLGTTTITATVTDFSNNTSTASFTITVNDVEAPVVTKPDDITVSNDAGLASAVVTFAVPTTTDNSGSFTIQQTAGPLSGSAFPLGTTTIAFTATDAAGNSTSTSFTITVNDTEPPTITAPANIVVVTDEGKSTAAVTFAVLTTTDNSGSFTIQQTAGPASGSAFPLGTTTIAFTATDAAGNSASASFTVTVNDAERPTITSAPANIVVSNDAGRSTAVVNFADATAADNSGAVAVQQTAGLASGSAFPLGTTTVTYTATDAAGNSAAVSFTVTVNDVAAPTFTTVPANMVFDNDSGQLTAVVNFADATASDNSGSVNVVRTGGPASGSAFPLGTTTVTYIATDAAGNSASTSFTVTVNRIHRAPSGTNANVATNEDTPYVFALADFAFTDAGDAPADALAAVQIASLPAVGVLQLDGNPVALNQLIATADLLAGRFRYVPPADAHGANFASFSFQVQDVGTPGVALDPTANTISIAVNPVADVAGDSITAEENTPITVNVLTGANGATADSFENPGRAVTAVTNPTNGTVQFQADGTITYTPTPLYRGPDSFSYTVTSGGTTESATVQVTVRPNASPTDLSLSPAALSEIAGPAAFIGALSATDPNAGDTFTFTLVPGAANNAQFTLSGNRLSALASLSFDDGSARGVRVRVVDSAGNAYEETLVVTVTTAITTWNATEMDRPATTTYFPGDAKSDYVHDLYAKILGRQASDAEAALWVGGLNTLGEARVVRGIFESFEHRVRQAQHFYSRFLGRAGTADEAKLWATVMINGMSEQEVASKFLMSAEFQGAKTDTAFIQSLYTTLLGRAGETEGVDGWLRLLAANRSREAIVRGFLSSAEIDARDLDEFYRGILSRASDADGFQQWFVAIQSTSAATVFQRFLSSQEFLSRSRP